MFGVFIFIWAFALLSGTVMVWLLAWAIRKGEFRNLQSGARMIFDDGEPMGVVTDRFPSGGRP